MVGSAGDPSAVTSELNYGAAARLLHRFVNFMHFHKNLSALHSDAPKDVNTHLLAFEIYYRKGRLCNPRSHCRGVSRTPHHPYYLVE